MYTGRMQEEMSDVKTFSAVYQKRPASFERNRSLNGNTIPLFFHPGRL
jgi:hypothetical protein